MRLCLTTDIVGSDVLPFKSKLTLMKALLASSMLLVACGHAFACDLSLVGTWKSDGPTTMAFVRENTKLQPKTEEFLQTLMGYMTLTFSESEVRSFMPDLEVSVGGQLRSFAGSEERTPYKVLFCGESTVVWSAKRLFGSTEEATTFNFVGPDTIWVYTGNTDPNVPDLHAREYFQRVSR